MQLDGDGDHAGDLCDVCPAVADPDQQDRDADGFGDACDVCPTTPDPEQADADDDGIGDACEPDVPPADSDADGVPDASDVCPSLADPQQADGDGDGAGDLCDSCPATAAAEQRDRDGDGTGDPCDPCPTDASCGPVTTTKFDGTGKRAHGEALLRYVTPTSTVSVVPAGTQTLALTLVIAPEVIADTVRVRVGRRDLTAALGTFVPGSTRTLTIPLARKRTIVRLQAEGPRTGGRRLVDADRLVVKTR
jgi:hypothetical protein